MEPAVSLDLTTSLVGFFCLAVFVGAYLLVMAEEVTHLRKAKPVLLAAGVIWASIAWAYAGSGMELMVEHTARASLLEYAELMLFLLVAMTYVNCMEERQVFDVLRAWMVNKGFSLRQIFWVTGLLAFFISPVADNLTTSLLMCAVILAVARDNPNFVLVACINIVVAANAGGAFSPFGDITTLMVWQQGKAGFTDFFSIFLPSLVNWLVPAAIMQFKVSKERPTGARQDAVLRDGALMVVGLFALTITTAVLFHQVLHLPPVLGMLTGLSLLQIYGYLLKRRDHREFAPTAVPAGVDPDWHARHFKPRRKGFDIFISTKRAEWDTLFFFYGVIMCVGGLGLIGYLALVSELLYGGLGATTANVVVGLLSAVVDNIPVMYAVLTMDPEMPLGEWLLVTLTAGVGGSLLSIGSAAGVALMGQARGFYTFLGHLRWTPVIALGFVASIACHLLVNQHLF